MHIHEVSKHMDLMQHGEFDCTRVVFEPVDGEVVQARYYGTWIHGEDCVPGEIEATFLEPVPADVDAVLNAGWDEWTVEEV